MSKPGEEGEAVEGEAVEGEAVEGEAVEGEAVEGEAVEGEAVEGEAVEGSHNTACLRFSFSIAINNYILLFTLFLSNLIYKIAWAKANFQVN